MKQWSHRKKITFDFVKIKENFKSIEYVVD
jgi:hypothetical protein